LAHPLTQTTKFDEILLQPLDLPIQEIVTLVHQTNHNIGADDAGTRRLHHLVNGAVALVQEALAEKHRARIVKERKSEDLEYLAVINYEILEYMFRNKANCHIKFSPNG